MKTIFISGILLAILAGLAFAFQAGFTGNAVKNPQGMPGDFYRVVDRVRSGEIQVRDVGEEYYKRPEFFPTYQNYSSQRGEHWGVMGYGAYPSDFRLSISGSGEAEIASIVHTSWKVETYQGLRLEPGHNSEYFDVEIQPQEILLEPSYPVFEDGWAQKVLIRIRMKNPPRGEHVIEIIPSSPSNELSEKVPEGRKYYGAGGFGIGRPLIRIAVRV